ncbi:copper resistance CopC/CopD family protein [Streptomyces sp. NPDC006739]|uniref:copper resistance CopC/CopD family protein n=1 Tax=Streptomyces sp. NPDC006739 TaxID=3364763 RepID=UPI00368823B2
MGDRRGTYGTTRRLRRLWRLTLLGGALLLLLFGGAGPASAHATLRASDPADGTVLKTAPRRITLTFSESVGLLDDSFRVYDPDNRRVRTGGADHAPGHSDTARVPLPARLGTGTFTVAWRVVSADSHPVAGAFTFSVGKPSSTTAQVSADPVENPATTSLYNIGRYLAYLAVALLVGTLAFAAHCRPPDPARLRRPALAGWWVLFASTLMLLVLRAPYEEGASPATAFTAAGLGRTVTGRPGQLLLARLALLLLAAAFLPVLRRRRTWSRSALAAGAVLAVALSLTWAAAEHASAGLQVPVAMVSAVLHLLAMAVWLGGLAALLTTLYRAAPPTAVVTRFSRSAFASVTVLVATGVYQSWRGLGSWQAFTDTSYGRILLAKLAAVVLLLAAAGQSRRWTARSAGAEVSGAVRDRVPQTVGAPAATSEPTPSSVASATTPPAVSSSAAAPSGSDPRDLRRSVLTEVAVGVLVLVLTTLLTGTQPGRAAAEAAGADTTGGVPAASVTTVPFDVGTPGAHGKVQVTLDPGRVGQNSVQAVVYGPDGGLSSVPELHVSFVLAAQKVGPLDSGITDRGGYWAADSFNLPIPGTWTMRVTVRVSELDQVTVTKPVRIER